MIQLKRNSREKHRENVLLHKLITIINDNSKDPLKPTDVIFNIKKIYVFTKLSFMDVIQIKTLQPLMNNHGIECKITDGHPHIQFIIPRIQMYPFWKLAIIYIFLIVIHLLSRQVFIELVSNNIELIHGWFYS